MMSPRRALVLGASIAMIAVASSSILQQQTPKKKDSQCKCVNI
jgi:hypothetical protein